MTLEVLNPATGETIAEVPERGRGRRPRRRGRAKALPEWLGTTPGERREALLELATRSRRTPTSWPARVQERGQAAPAFREDEIPVCADNLRFFAGAARILEGRAAGEYMRGYTSLIRREPLGVVGRSRPGTTR